MEALEDEFLNYYQDCLSEYLSEILAHDLACVYVAGKYGITKDRMQNILDYLGYHLPPIKWTHNHD